MKKPTAVLFAGMSSTMVGIMRRATTKAPICTIIAITPQIAMSTRLTLCWIAEQSGTMNPRIEPDRLKAAAMLPPRMSSISR